MTEREPGDGLPELPDPAPSPPRAVDPVRTEAAVHELLAAWGIAPDDPRIARTAARVAQASVELLAGEGVDPVPALRNGRIAAPDSDLVLLRNIRFSALCEHHLLPFDGYVHLAYLPGDSIVGFGRLYDLVATCAGRLTLQERLGEQLVDALMLGLESRGALAIVEAAQGCVTARGPRQHDSDAVSVAARGSLVDGEGAPRRSGSSRSPATSTASRTRARARARRPRPRRRRRTATRPMHVPGPRAIRRGSEPRRSLDCDRVSSGWQSRVVHRSQPCTRPSFS